MGGLEVSFIKKKGDIEQSVAIIVSSSDDDLWAKKTMDDLLETVKDGLKGFVKVQ